MADSLDDIMREAVYTDYRPGQRVVVVDESMGPFFRAEGIVRTVYPTREINGRPTTIVSVAFDVGLYPWLSRLRAPDGHAHCVFRAEEIDVIREIRS